MLGESIKKTFPKWWVSLCFQTPGEEVFAPQKHTDQTPFTSGGMTGRQGFLMVMNPTNHKKKQMQLVSL